MTVCCGVSFLFQWDQVVVFGQPNYTSNALNARLGFPNSLAVDPVDGSLWVGVQQVPLQSNISGLLVFSTKFSANSSSFVLQPSKSIPLPNNTAVFVESFLWVDSQTCLMGSENYNNADGSNLFVTRDHFTTTQQLPVDYNAFNDAISGLGYSKTSNQVFVSKYFENQIRVLENDGFFNRTLYLIGNAFNNNTAASPPTASSLNYPGKIQQDCGGGFWVVDRGNCRVLHFGWNQTVADAVIGQPNFTTSCSSNIFIFQAAPFGIAMNSDCSIMWIADLYRILRFRAPFNSASQPEGVLGRPDFSFYYPYPTSASTFSGIYDIQYDSKTQRLYIADPNNNRVVAGITDEGSSRLTIIYNNVTYNSGETLQINSSVKDQTLAIAASLELKNGSSTRLNEGQLVLVAQSMTFGGELTLKVASAKQNVMVNLFNYSSYDNSRFAQITVELNDDGETSKCKVTGSTAQYGAKNMGVIISFSSGCDSESTSNSHATGDGNTTRSIIIGVVVGATGFLILICLGLAIVLILVAVVGKKMKRNRQVTAKV